MIYEELEDIIVNDIKQQLEQLYNDTGNAQHAKARNVSSYCCI